VAKLNPNDALLGVGAGAGIRMGFVMVAVTVPMAEDSADELVTLGAGIGADELAPQSAVIVDVTVETMVTVTIPSVPMTTVGVASALDEVLVGVLVMKGLPAEEEAVGELVIGLLGATTCLRCL